MIPFLTDTSYLRSQSTPKKSSLIEKKPFPNGTKVRRAVPPKDYHLVAKMTMKRLKALDLPEVRKPLQRLTDKLILTNNLPHKSTVRPSGILKYNAMAVGMKEFNNIKLITIGVLKAAKSPEEVAFVLGHELGHIQHQDSKIRLLLMAAKPLVVAIITGLAAIGCLEYNKKHKNKQSAPFKPFEALSVVGAGLLTFLAFSRFQGYRSRLAELRADRMAIDYLQKAGFSTKGYKDALKNTASRELGIKGGERIGLPPHKEWLRKLLEGPSHPTSKQRTEAIEKYLAEHPDPVKATPVMSKKEWNAFQREITPIFRQLEQERGQEIMNTFYLDLDVVPRPPGKKQPPPYVPK